jgi:hypothetical protein
MLGELLIALLGFSNVRACNVNLFLYGGNKKVLLL